jgi:glycyl-tRNA synthetase beta chain
MATPRRIAIIASGLAVRQREEETEIKGPAVSAAYDAAGKATRALEGFLRGNQVEEKDLFRRDMGKGEYIFAKKLLASKATVEIIPDIIRSLVSGIPFPKRMRWSDKSLTFPRPIDYFAIIFNNAVVPFEIEGIGSSNRVRGHYVQNNTMITVDKIADYESLLRKNSVIVNHQERKDHIRRELVAAAEKVNCDLVMDEDLLNVVTFLVENPHVVTCDFNPEFLAVPDVALIAVMKEHQKYFPLHERKGGLTNKFLVVSNNPPTPIIKAGNERVITARFNDARFFFQEDRRQKLADLVEPSSMFFSTRSWALFTAKWSACSSSPTPSVT